jgi:hypothetical protein
MELLEAGSFELEIKAAYSLTRHLPRSCRDKMQRIILDLHLATEGILGHPGSGWVSDETGPNAGLTNQSGYDWAARGPTPSS